MSNKTSKSKQKTNTSSKKVVTKKTVKKKNTSRVGLLFFILIMFLIILIGTVFGSLQQVRANRTETEELTNRYIEVLEEEASLNSQVIKLQDPEYKARYARENQLYTKDGETILIIIDEISKKAIKKNEELILISTFLMV